MITTNRFVTLHVIDTAIDEQSRIDIVNYMYSNKASINGIISLHMIPYSKFIVDNSAVGKLFRVAEKFFDISNAIAYEKWHNVDSRPTAWHFDKDEILFKETGKLSYPICTMLYYPFVQDNLKGGELRIRPDLNSKRDIFLQPKTNRLVIFSPGTLHTVQPFEGQRLSMVINPWNQNIMWASGEVGESQQTVNLPPSAE